MTVKIYDVAIDSGFRCNCIQEMSKGFGNFSPERWMRYNNLYDVSDWGRVGYRPTKRVLHQYPNGRGYASVRFRGEEYNRPVHMMVLPTFYPRQWYSPNAVRSYDMIDHKNHNRMDPSLENLRYSNNTLNQMNRKNVKGYYAQKKKDGSLSGRFCAAIRVQKKNTSLGSFGSAEEASTRYREAVQDAYEVLEY